MWSRSVLSVAVCFMYTRHGDVCVCMYVEQKDEGAIFSSRSFLLSFPASLKREKKRSLSGVMGLDWMFVSNDFFFSTKTTFGWNCFESLDTLPIFTTLRIATLILNNTLGFVLPCVAATWMTRHNHMNCAPTGTGYQNHQSTWWSTINMQPPMYIFKTPAVLLINSLLGFFDNYILYSSLDISI